MRIRQHVLSYFATIACFLLLTLASFAQQTTVEYPTSLQQLHRNMLDDIMTDAAENLPLAREHMQTLHEKGFWPDINYASQERGAWAPATHLSRMLTLAQAYRLSGAEFYNDKQLGDKIHRALNYWLDKDLICPNWWYPEIGVPMRLAPTLFLMEAELSEEQKEKAIKILDRAEMGMTGQNKVWLAGNVLMKSLLLRDTATIPKAAQSIQEELRAGEGEGIQPDWSFHQHGPQLQFGNYGLSYVSSMIQWVKLLRDTPFAFNEEKVAIIRNYLLEGQQWISWKERMDISACGRQLFIDEPATKAASLSRSFRNMEALDPAFADAYQRANHPTSRPGNKHFWRSDFHVHRTDDYYFSVKMCSERVAGAECCNSENIQGYHMGDGAAFLYQTGREYENIFPFWDWRKVPGITVHQDDQPLPRLTCRGYRLETDFVGGVSNGEVGIAALDYVRDGLQARKSWFMFGEAIVCLGAGITSAQGLPVTTSINQIHLEGRTVVKDQQRKTVKKGYSSFQDPKWIWHNYTGYLFPAGADIVLENQSVTGAWNWVATRYPEEKMETEIFRLWLDHGRNPVKQSYAYFMVPNADIKAMEKLEAAPPLRILQNSKECQAVVSADGQMAGIVFYQAGKVDVLGGVEVDEPCILLVQKEKEQLRIFTADPTQKSEEIQVTLNGRYSVAKGDFKLTSEGNSSTLLLRMPREGDMGKTVPAILKRQ